MVNGFVHPRGSYIWFQCKPRMVNVEFKLIILSLIVFFYKEELLDAYKCKLNFACTLFECNTLIHHLLCCKNIYANISLYVSCNI